MSPVPTKQVLDDGLCFVQPLLKVGATSGHASNHEMGQAKIGRGYRAMIIHRRANVRLAGGGDNKLVIAIAKYEPNIRCDRSLKPGPSWESCIHIWGVMQASQIRQVFEHPETDPRVDMSLLRTKRVSFPVNTATKIVCGCN